MAYNKFCSLVESKVLAAALESPYLGERFLRDGVKESDLVIFRGRNGAGDKLYYPATQGDVIIFRPGDILEDPFSYWAEVKKVRPDEKTVLRLVFRAQRWCVAGRFGELSPFGFEKTRGSPPEVDYISLAFPGITGTFSPVFFSMKDPWVSYYEVLADSEAGMGNVVKVCSVAFSDIPSCLKKRL